jgi:predicted nucleic acid-binding Zn ribbon protein
VQVRREQRDATRKPHELLDLAPRPCTVCGAAFKPTRRAQKYCSRKCRLHGIYEARKADGRIQLAGPAVERHLTCVRCGSGFAQTGPGRPRRYCSKTCKTAI